MSIAAVFEDIGMRPHISGSAPRICAALLLGSTTSGCIKIKHAMGPCVECAAMHLRLVQLQKRAIKMHGTDLPCKKYRQNRTISGIVVSPCINIRNAVSMEELLMESHHAKLCGMTLTTRVCVFILFDAGDTSNNSSLWSLL